MRLTWEASVSPFADSSSEGHKLTLTSTQLRRIAGKQRVRLIKYRSRAADTTSTGPHALTNERNNIVDYGLDLVSLAEIGALVEEASQPLGCFRWSHGGDGHWVQTTGQRP